MTQLVNTRLCECQAKSFDRFYDLERDAPPGPRAF